MKLKLFLLMTLCCTLLICGVLSSCKSEAEPLETTADPVATSPNPEGNPESTAESKPDDAITGGITGETIGEPADETTEEPESEPMDKTETETEGKVEDETMSETESITEYVEPIITGPYADTIMHANRLADRVQAYYANVKRTAYRIENMNMGLEYTLSSSQPNLIASLTNAKGQPYIENTMDVFIAMDDGKTYWASDSTAAPHTNIYRMGYYYYDTHIMGQNFMGGASITTEMPFKITKATVKSNQVKDLTVNDGMISYTADGADPYVYTVANKNQKGLCFPAETYNAVQFSVKTSSTEGYLYFIAGSKTGHNPEQEIRFDIEANGEWNTYTVALNTAPDYTDIVTSLRFDIGNPGEKVEIKDIKAIHLDTSAPAVLLDRTFHTYSDKMNQVLHFVASSEVEGIEGMGFMTSISADTVAKLMIKDANSIHDSLDGVDFATCEYAAFDIKDVGILGFILLPHENSGKLEISLEGGIYTVTQTATPEGGVLHYDPNTTADDFYMGHRLYTDENHDFDAFLREAEIERHPLETVSGESYLGYDVLRGAYKFKIGGTGFNEPFFTEQNRHYTADVAVKGNDSDRNIYVYTYFEGGCGENALVLDKDDMLLPIPVMIYKNFKGENEEPIFDPGDPSYSETYFPVCVKAGSTTELTVLNLYMNWGQIPLKQLSSIQFFWPYYHLSLGTTETSCISPLYGARDLWTLPDFRSMSMPYWFELPEGQGYSNQPQHTHGGFQYFLQYTDAEGNYSATENYHNDIISSGPVYTDVKMDYISDDGRIKASYNHLELPETDELRAYYEINYTVLEDISIADFAKDFSFYSLEGYAGKYQKIGYLGENNEIVHAETNLRLRPEVIKLGDNFPYVALYDLKADTPDWATNNVNLGFIIADSEFIIGGEACDAGFVLTGSNAKYSLSLDLGATTLKAGDTMKLCIIISPWGFYTSTDDSNMQKIRENTCLNPLKLTVQDGEAMDSVYLPKVKSTDGKSAEFTVSGGSNNKAVRVYGFEKLTAPIIYEKINGKWVELTVNSSQTPDIKGHAHFYDGYTVYYDRDGTYSYAFAFNMDNAESRSFRVVARKDFTGWPEEGGASHESSNMKVLVAGQELKQATVGAGGIGKTEISEDESYVRIFGSGDGAAEAFFRAYQNSDLSPTGQYLAVKYRLPENNPDKIHFEFFISTKHPDAQAGESFMVNSLIADGEWHVLLVDMADQMLPTFEADSSGSYTALYLRFDIFNTPVSADTYVDIAYVAMADSLDNICKHNQTGIGEIYKGGVIAGTLDFATGASPDAEDIMNPNYYVDPTSGWTISDVRYASMIDFINGKGDGDGAYDARGTNSDKPLDLMDYNNSTVDGSKLALAGWAVANGGIDKYMWSADGGKTWQECSLYAQTSFGDVSLNEGIANSANQFFSASGYKVTEHPDKIVFQGTEGIPSGVCADLAAYAGQKVDVIFALVPLNDSDGLCIMTVVRGVEVES
ncbi:MAG: hypothetical protein E7661_04315 [Ruminococcaceae bacterium]|nr:hypothetical protein [Oscillospiraceae bacterium]